ncbi:MAG TPA: hypothetical protein VJH97_04585 [Candidatus Nanoarchaeia archaeon]|nr:hypothetical protein [Candidatus Nanoarchaeia archaeon]
MNLDVPIHISNPKTREDFNKYYDLRFRILRKPLSPERQRASAYETTLTSSIPHNAQIEVRISGYTKNHPDIGVAPVVVDNQLLGFGVSAKKFGAGYTGMNQDIVDLAKQSFFLGYI